MSAPDRIRQWLREVAIARAEDAVPVPGGVAIRHSRFPLAHDHNRILLWSEVSAGTVVASADDVLGGAGLDHRLIDVLDVGVADRLAPDLHTDGYLRSDALVMTYDGAAPPPPATSCDEPVSTIDLDERSAAATAGWHAEQPEWSAEVCRQLGQRIRTITDVVDPTFLAVRDGPDVIARTDLYLSGGVAQVEEVVTEPAARGRGLASQLVAESITRARGAGAEVIFLIVDMDGPVALYRRLGFAECFTMASFSR